MRDEMSSDLQGQAAALFDETSKAWADGDADAFTRWYAEGATVILPGFHLRDRAEIHSGMAAAFAGPLKGSTRVHVVRSARSLGDDTAVVVTQSATTLAGENEAERWELATWVLSRNHDRWLIEAYHSCPANV
jgi:uncharacterized protein (TIGR02246 family)